MKRSDIKVGDFFYKKGNDSSRCQIFKVVRFHTALSGETYGRPKGGYLPAVFFREFDVDASYPNSYLSVYIIRNKEWLHPFLVQLENKDFVPVENEHFHQMFRLIFGQQYKEIDITREK